MDGLQKKYDDTINPCRKMCIPDYQNYEFEILQKYFVGHVIDETDREIIEELALVGLVRIGLSLKQNSTTAKTTTLGQQLIGGMTL
jgi:hypothetical protein